MKIIETDYKWNSTLTNRQSTSYIALHHRGGNGDANSIHAQHQNQGWSGIGYHFYIRKDGSIYRGRPINTVGAHISGFNSYSVGICFEGNYHTIDKSMPVAQLKAGQELVSYLKSLYPDTKVVKHKDLGSTACPGQHFPFDEIVSPPPALLKNADEITWELNHKYFKIHDYEGFIKALDKEKKENSPMYWGYYKLVNNIKE